MIKPNTLCMIRGVPQGRPGHEFNGNIVVAKGVKKLYDDGTPIYWIEPELVDSNRRVYTGCREQWLWPFEDPDTLLISALDKQLEHA